MSLQTQVPDVAKCHDSRRTCRQQETNCQSTDVDEAIDPDELFDAVRQNPDVVRRVTAKARKLSRRRGFSKSDTDDIEQEMWIAIAGACRSYCRERGLIESFAGSVIQNVLAALIRHRTADLRTYATEAGSLNDVIDDGEGPVEWIHLFDADDRSNHLGGRRRPQQSQSDLSHDLPVVIAKLPVETRAVAELLMHHPPGAIAEKLGMTRGKVRGHISLIQEHFEEHGLDEYLKF